MCRKYTDVLFPFPDVELCWKTKWRCPLPAVSLLTPLNTVGCRQRAPIWCWLAWVNRADPNATNIIVSFLAQTWLWSRPLFPFGSSRTTSSLVFMLYGPPTSLIAFKSAGLDVRQTWSQVLVLWRARCATLSKGLSPQLLYLCQEVVVGTVAEPWLKCLWPHRYPVIQIMHVRGLACAWHVALPTHRRAAVVLPTIVAAGLQWGYVFPAAAETEENGRGPFWVSYQGGDPTQREQRAEKWAVAPSCFVLFLGQVDNQLIGTTQPFMLYVTPLSNENEVIETGPAVQVNAVKFPSKSALTNIYKVGPGGGCWAWRGGRSWSVLSQPSLQVRGLAQSRPAQ